MNKAVIVAAALALSSAPAFAQGGMGQFGGTPQQGTGQSGIAPTGPGPVSGPGQGQFGGRPQRGTGQSGVAQPSGNFSGGGQGQFGGRRSGITAGGAGMEQGVMPGRRLARGHRKMKHHHRRRGMR